MADFLIPFAGVLGVASAVTYAVLRLVYGRFYGEFGLEPEDVGLGQTELLSQAVTGPAVYALAHAVVLFIVLFGYAVVGLFNLKARPPGEPESIRQRVADQGWLRGVAGGVVPQLGYALRTAVGSAVLWWHWLAGVAAVLALALVLAGLFFNAARLAEAAKYEGATFHTVDSELGPLRLPMLDVQALPVELSDASASTARLPDGECLLYLGASGTTVVVYDVAERRTYKIPAESLVLAFRLDGGLDAECAGPTPGP